MFLESIVHAYMLVGQVLWQNDLQLKVQSEICSTACADSPVEILQTLTFTLHNSSWFDIVSGVKPVKLRKKNYKRIFLWNPSVKILLEIQNPF